MSVVNYPGFVIPSTTIAVDFWPKSKYDHLTHHFLTHAHTDHTQGLDSTWCGSNIYCSKVTKKILVHFNLVDPEWIVELEMDKVHVFKLDDDESFNLTLIDANHCPGAVMYLFQGYFGNVLVTGDFRFDLDIVRDSGLLTTEIEICFLDNTYFNELYADVPSRKQATDDMIDLIEKKRAAEPNLMVNLKMKKLGKEELLVKLSKHFSTPICMSEFAYDKCVKHLELNSDHFTTEFSESTFIFMDDVDTSGEEAKSILANRQVIVIEPSALRAPFFETDAYNNYFIVPYSDHSSYNEIVDFVKLIKPKKLVPIVRKPLPKNTDTSDLSVLDKYLSRKPLIDSHDTYKLLLQSKSSMRRSSRLNVFRHDHDQSKKSALRSRSFMMRKRKQSPEPAAVVVNNKRMISVRSKKQKTEIEYESSPEKEPSEAAAAQMPAIKISCPSFYEAANKRRSARIKSLDLKKTRELAGNTRARSLGSEPTDKSSVWLKVTEQLEIMPSSSESSDESFTPIPEETSQNDNCGDVSNCVPPVSPETREPNPGQEIPVPSPEVDQEQDSGEKNYDFDNLLERFGHTIFKPKALTRDQDSDSSSVKSSICIEHTLSESLDSQQNPSSSQKQVQDGHEADHDQVSDQVNISFSGINLGKEQYVKAATPKKKAQDLGFLDFMSLRLNSAAQLNTAQDARSFQDHCSNIRSFLFDSFKF